MRSLDSYFSFEGIEMGRAMDNDIDTLVAVINSSYAYQDNVKGTQRTNQRDLRKRIAETDFYVLRDGSLIIGCIYIKPDKTKLHFGLLTLEPSYRGKGIAAAIISAMESFGKANQFGALELDYMSLAPWLNNYYKKYGFTATGEVFHWGEMDLLRMSKTL